jgi:hypothetical protein
MLQKYWAGIPLPPPSHHNYTYALSVVDITIKIYQQLEVLQQLWIFILVLSNYNGQSFNNRIVSIKESRFGILQIKHKSLLTIFVFSLYVVNI